MSRQKAFVRTVSISLWTFLVVLVVLWPDSASAQTVTVVATDAVAAEQGSNPGVFTITRTAPLTAALPVNCSLTGTATNGGPNSDYNTTPSPVCSNTVTIPAGMASVTVTITPIDDAVPEGNETVIFTVLPGTGYTPGPAPNNTAMFTITDNDLPTVMVTATDASAAEQGQNPGIFTITRNGPTTAALTVNCSLTGSATNGGANSDYTTSPSPVCAGTVTIPAASASVTVTITPVDDTVPEADETVILTVLASAGVYNVAAPPNNSATVTITDNDLPTVSVTATDASAAEQGQNTGTFTITRNGPTTLPLTVSCSLTGGATNGGANSDYTTSPSPVCAPTVIIPAGSGSITVTITPIDDTTPEGEETVILTVLPNTAIYNVAPAPNNAATVIITDNDVSTVSVIATDASAAEQGLNTGIFTITRTAPLTAALIVNCSLTGTATNGGVNSDYTVAPSPVCATTITIPAGVASVTVTVTPIDDTAAEADETVVFTVLPNTAIYNVGAPPTNTATVTITDNDPPALALASGGSIPASLSPNQQVRFSVSLPASFTLPTTALTGHLDVSFVPALQSRQDPSMLFQNQTALTSVNFSIPASSRQGTFLDANGQPFAGAPAGSVGFQPGTNAGTIVLAISISGSVANTSVTTAVEGLKPTITGVAAQRNSNGMTITVTGFSTPRNINLATFTFSGPNQSPQTVPLTQAGALFTGYFAGPTSVNGGSRFTLTAPFIINNGTPDQFNSVSVTLTNMTGSTVNTSDAVSISY